MKFRSNVVAFALLALLSMVPGAFGAMYQWSKTAGTNATADATINWAEGMAPSAVNDSARAMMARTKEWVDDISGTVATGGTSTAYTLTTNQVFSSRSAMNGAMITFTAHATNGDNATLNVDGTGAKQIQSAIGTNIPAGTLIANSQYTVTYSHDNAFLLRGFYGSTALVPVGAMLEFTGPSAPSGFVFPVGQAVSRTTYATYFAMVGTTYGAGDGSTTFNVPDLRGRVTAGVDNMGGVAAGRIGSVVTDSGTIVGATLGSVGGSSTHALTTSEIPSHTHTGTTSSNGAHTHTFGDNAAGGSFINGAATGNTNAAYSTASSGAHTHTFTSDATGGGAAHSMLQPTMMVNKILRII